MIKGSGEQSKLSSNSPSPVIQTEAGSIIIEECGHDELS